MIGPADIAAFEACLRAGGVTVFGADTVYGLACAAADAAAARRLYAIKGRAPDKPAAVMFLDLGVALETLTELGTSTRSLLERLLPGPLTVLIPNPGGRYPAACGPDPQTLGLRVPALVPGAAALSAVRAPLLQSSANPAGGAEARRLGDVDPGVRAGADLCLDAGELPGTASTVLDLRGYEETGAWAVLREGAVSTEALAGAIR